MNRHDLDTFAARHGLAPPAVAAALGLTGLAPDAPAWRAFAATLLRAAGLGALGAGVLFFVAANWQDYGVLGRFVLLQAALVACIAAALWRPPPARPGQAALILATLLVGGLLALFGQSYQTGADVYELFLAWALLALPFALAGLSGALWAVWFAVLNVGLALLFGWLGPAHFVWRVLDGHAIDRAGLLMLPGLVNLLAAGACLGARRTRFAAAAPGWLARFLATLGFLYGTAAALSAVTGAFHDRDLGDTGGQCAATLLVFAALSAGIGFGTWRARRDVFPLTLIAASWIAISTTALAQALEFKDIGTFFLIAFWLIAASTASGLLLMRWVRAWRVAPPAASPTEGSPA